jgi:hypothetical protein
MCRALAAFYCAVLAADAASAHHSRASVGEQQYRDGQ